MTQHKATTTRLDIVGFKSFADEIHLDILPGLTGIVGPNGCGKSNIVEALRWTMGESSARALRGGESDDLIFAGTGNRPARNLARVTLHLGEAAGLAPPPFQEASELEVSRQAERGSGSTYRINNRVMRARDVQTIFADLSSGARSSSIISQNRVSQLIAARPEERRHLLEEAAGITGLYVRRKDAELKLRQAESNLERAEEHKQTLDQQLATLSGQSEKAQEYRSISEDIRRYEHDLLILQHARAEEQLHTHRHALEKAQKALKNSETALQESKNNYAILSKTRARQVEEIDTLRPQLEQSRIKIEVAQNSLQHTRQASQEHARQLAQIEADLTRQKEALQGLVTQQEDAQNNLSELLSTKQALNDQQPEIEAKVTELSAQAQAKKEEFEAASSRYHAESIRYERLQSRQNSLATQIENAQRNLETLQENFKKLETDCLQQQPQEATKQKAQDALAQAEQTHTHATTAETYFQEQRLTAERAKRDVQDATTQLANLKARIEEASAAIHKLQARLQEDTQHAEQATARLLSDKDKQNLSEASDKARSAFHAAAQKEKDLTLQREKAEQAWLNEKAAHEKTEQRRAFLVQESERLRKIYREQTTRHDTAQHTLKAAQKTAIPSSHIQNAQDNLGTLTNKLSTLRKEIETHNTQLSALTEKEETAQTALQTTESQLITHKGEYEGLKKSLQSSSAAVPHPLLEQLDIPTDLTRAIASALTDGLEASLPPSDIDISETPRQWRKLANMLEPSAAPTTQDSSLLKPLAELITAPPALQRAFSAIFLITDAKHAPALQEALTPGQAIVCKEGGLWRWDGFIRSPNTPTAEMIRLEQAQNMKACASAITQLTQQAEKQRRDFSTLQKEIQDLKATLQQLHNSLTAQSDEHAKTRHHLEGLQQRHALQQEQISLLENEVANHANARAQTTQQLKAAQTEQEALPRDNAKRLKEAETTLQTLRDLSHTARQEAQKLQEALHDAEKQQQQALFQHESTLARLKELQTACAQHKNEIQALTQQEADLKDEHSKIDLKTLSNTAEQTQLQLHDAQQKALKASQAAQDSQKAATLLQQQLEEQHRILTGLLARKESLAQQIASQEESLKALLNEEKTCKAEAATLPDMPALAAQQKTAEAALNTSQNALQEQQTHYTKLIRDLSLQSERSENLQKNLAEQAQRITQLQKDIQNLNARREELIQAAPASDNSSSLAGEEQIQSEKQILAELEAQHTALQDTLKQTELQLKEQGSLLEQHRESCRRYREEGIRLNERYEQADEALAVLRHNSPRPDGATVPDDISPEAEQRVRRALNRSTKQRDGLGPVNLCAEDEFQTAKTEAERIEQEHQDLSTAIARLRGGVGAINREGRHRLMTVFADINQHFQQLFTRMFSGGKAHLEMVGSDDPLEAGLEIFAQPPGKKLSTLSLLSGGEQALTALSLIFAAFHCTPAPICVLDEVDAPLDDANVERFCTLLRDITKQTGTRFLVVTHHQLTMAHMDRLFGVTMQERGVSRLLSVNLDESIRMVNG